MSIDKSIEALASIHLGKAGDGTVVKPYVTPDAIDASLLVGVPRVLNRTAYDITKDTVMYGYDTWHAYEFSTLLPNGYPLTGAVKIVYPSDSDNIVESKSLKLYMNSWNMHMLELVGNDLLYGYQYAAGRYIELRIEHDLKRVLGTNQVDVAFFPSTAQNSVSVPFTRTFATLDEIVDVTQISFTRYNESADILENRPWMSDVSYAIHTPSLRSNCRVTNQPDWGDVFVYMKGMRYAPTYESFLQYIVSMRRENHFHEEICECIYKRLLDRYNPEELAVACLYTRRGGIDINPIRANCVTLPDTLGKGLVEAWSLTQKTQRQ